MSILIKGAKMPKKGVITLIIDAEDYKAKAISFDGNCMTFANHEVVEPLPYSELYIMSDGEPILVAPIKGEG